MQIISVQVAKHTISGHRITSLYRLLYHLSKHHIPHACRDVYACPGEGARRTSSSLSASLCVQGLLGTEGVNSVPTLPRPHCRAACRLLLTTSSRIRDNRQAMTSWASLGLKAVMYSKRVRIGPSLKPGRGGRGVFILIDTS